MKETTRKSFNQMCARLATAYGVESVTRQFTVAPSIEQRLQDKIVEQSEFLPKINVITVDEMAGENILGSASGPVSGRTDTSVPGAERAPRDVLGLDKYLYQLFQTNSDVYMRYATMDAWAKFPDFHNRYVRYVQRRIANDRELVGWYGVEAAADTDLVAAPLLQDVNKGWMQYMRDNLPANVLAEGAVPDEIHIGAGGDYLNLDNAVADLALGIPRYMRTGLVTLIGDELIGQEKSLLYAAIGATPTEKTLATASLTLFGGLPWLTPSNFPGRGLVITSFDNLSIYVQSDTWRRNIKDKPEKDRVEDYNSRNEGYVVETPEKFVALEFANVKLPDGEGWA
jgi:P2 family phage major capsid protein